MTEMLTCLIDRIIEQQKIYLVPNRRENWNSRGTESSQDTNKRGGGLGETELVENKN